MVPPQFTPCGASRDPNRSAGCIGPYPSSPTEFFSEAAPKGIPYPDLLCLAPTGSSLGKPCEYVVVFIIALSVSVKHKFTTGGRLSQYHYAIFFSISRFYSADFDVMTGKVLSFAGIERRCMYDVSHWKNKGFLALKKVNLGGSEKETQKNGIRKL